MQIKVMAHSNQLDHTLTTNSHTLIAVGLFEKISSRNQEEEEEDK